MSVQRFSQFRVLFPEGLLIAKKLDRAFPGDTPQLFGRSIDWVSFEATHAGDELFLKAYTRPKHYTFSKTCEWLASLPEAQAKDVIKHGVMTPGQKVGLAYFYATRREFYIQKRRRQLLEA